MIEKNHLTRISLIQRIQQDQKDEHCWEDFVESYESYISSIIYFFKLNPSIHDDLLQDVLLQIYKSLPKFEYRPGECKFRTWLSLVTRSVIKTYLKSKANQTTKKNVEYDEALASLERVTEPEIEERSEKEWQVFIIEKALKNISKDTSAKIMVALEAHLNEKPDSEVAEDLKTTAASVRVYRQRGLNALKKEVHRLTAELDFQS